MNQITRRLEFDAGHRLVGHESKCANLHGHRYVAEVTCQADGLDDVGRVVDFSVVKQKVGGWIDEYWDHNMILNEKDSLTGLWAEYEESSEGDSAAGTHRINEAYAIFNGKAPYIVPFNPTAENMVKYLFAKSQQLLQDYPIKVVKIRLYETPNCWADYEVEE